MGSSFKLNFINYLRLNLYQYREINNSKMQISTGYPNHGISIPIKPNSPPVLSSPHRNLVQSIGFVKPKSTHMFQSLNPTQYPNQIY